MKYLKISDPYKFSFSNHIQSDFQIHPKSTPKFNSIQIQQKPLTIPSNFSQKTILSKHLLKPNYTKNIYSKPSKLSPKKFNFTLKKNQYFNNSHSLQDLRNNQISSTPSNRIKKQKSNEKSKKNKLIDILEIKQIQKQLLQNNLKIKSKTQNKQIQLQLNQLEYNQFSFSQLDPQELEYTKLKKRLKFNSSDRKYIKNNYQENKQIIKTYLFPQTTKSNKTNKQLFFRKKNYQQKRGKFHFNKMALNRVKKRQPEKIRLSQLSYKIQCLNLQQI